MFAALAALCFLQTPQPADRIGAMIDRYRKLKKLRYVIVHHNDVLVRGVPEVDRVRWTNPGHFEIYTLPYGDNQAAVVPQMVCDDSLIESLSPGAFPVASPLDPGPDKVGGWEGRGGYLLCLLMKGKSWDKFVKPEPKMDVSYVAGPATTWHDQPVREIEVMRKLGTYQDHMSIYLEPDADVLVGIDFAVVGSDVWTEYHEIVETP